MNFGSCWQVTFSYPEENLELFESFLEEYFDVMACNYEDDGSDEYVGYKSLGFDESAMRETAAAWNLKLPPYQISFLESKNWLAENVIKFAPVEVAEFKIYGIHETDIPPSDKITMRIYAATAFGSEHQTTKSCLQAISDFNQLKRPHRRVLDMGTGSGILALACAKLWGNTTQLIAVDIDEEAVKVTTQNAVDNEVDGQITVAVSDGYNSQLVKNNAPYDLIIANILARPLIEMATDLSASLQPGGCCILSGFVADQEEWVIGAHRQQGLKLLQLYKLDSWRAALMEKPL